MVLVVLVVVAVVMWWMVCYTIQERIAPAEQNLVVACSWYQSSFPFHVDSDVDVAPCSFSPEDLVTS